MNKSRPFYHIIFSVYPLLNYVNANIYSIYTFTFDIALICAACLAAACLLYMALLAVFKSSHKAALLTASLLLLFFSYWLIYKKAPVPMFSISGKTIARGQIVLLLYVPVVCLLFAAVKRINNSFENATRILNFTSITLIAVAGFNLFATFSHLNRTIRTQPIEKSVKLNKAAPRPDIYYFILDAYASNKTLALFGYDNTPFVKNLENRGFNVLKDPRSNYVFTKYSLPSFMNMKYVDDAANNQDSYLTVSAGNNRAMKILKSLGYRYIHLGSRYAITHNNRLADKNMPCRGGSLFIEEFLKTTPLKPLMERLSYYYKRKHTLCQFEELKKISSEPGPKFVFVHMEASHRPFVFKPDGKPHFPEFDKQGTFEECVDQIKFLNANLIPVIDSILAMSKSKPVIIMHSDHGPSGAALFLPSRAVRAETASDIEDRSTGIFSAFLLPDGGASKLYPGITPVNYLRVVFNHYFDSGFSILPDKTYIYGKMLNGKNKPAMNPAKNLRLNDSEE